MYQELGLLCVLFLPVLLIYFYRSNALDDDHHDNSNRATTTKKSKKSKKKKGKGRATSLDTKTTTTDEPSLPVKTTTLPITTTSNASHSKQKENKLSSSLGKQFTSSQDAQSSRPKDKAAEGATNELTIKETTSTSDSASKDKKESFAAAAGAANKSNEPSREIDKHMDLTPRYSRVMRITTEPEEQEWEPVPYEDGWESIGSSKKPIYSAPRTQEVMSKKQRENQAKAAKRKEAKAAADALQAERLRRHQKELERQKINEFYSTGAGKNTPWGKKGQKGTSSKTPTATAGLNEKGQLIWD